MSFSQHVASLVAFRFTGSGAVESFSVTRSRISRANVRAGYLRAQFARPVERYRVAWPVWRVLTWVFSRGLRALFVLRQMESQNRTGNASSLADRVQPDRNFRYQPRFTDDFQTRKWRGAVQVDLISYDTFGRESKRRAARLGWIFGLDFRGLGCWDGVLTFRHSLEKFRENDGRHSPLFAGLRGGSSRE